MVNCCDHRNYIYSYRFCCFSKTSPFVISIAISFAAGAILVMLAESMIPEAFEEDGSKIGLATMTGFTIAFIL